jgi:hypothetical protein
MSFDAAVISGVQLVKEKQANFEVPKNYDETFYLKVEKQLNNIVSEHK